MMATQDQVKTAEDILRTMEAAACDGVRGVMRISSRTSGPIVGITAYTHGNEPSGLFAIDYLLHTLKLQENLLRGEIYLVVNNLRAAQESKRFINVDMNRLPSDMPGRVNDPDYEVNRARELLPIWSRFDAGLDIHSTTQDAPPMIISLGTKFHAELARGFPIQILVSNIDQVQRGKPATAFYGSAGAARVLGIEAGQHTSDKAMICASACVTAFLQNLEMIEGEPGDAVHYREYRVVDKIILPNDTYSVVRAFPNFATVKKGELVAQGEGPDIVMPIDGHAIMHNGKPKPNGVGNEVFFITEPVRQW